MGRTRAVDVIDDRREHLVVQPALPNCIPLHYLRFGSAPSQRVILGSHHDSVIIGKFEQFLLLLKISLEGIERSLAFEKATLL